MSTAEYEAAKAKLIAACKRAIKVSNTILSMIANNPNIQPEDWRGALDPESATIMGGMARKVLKACERGERIDPRWIAAIKLEVDRE